MLLFGIPTYVVWYVDYLPTCPSTVHSTGCGIVEKFDKDSTQLPTYRHLIWNSCLEATRCDGKYVGAAGVDEPMLQNLGHLSG